MVRATTPTHEFQIPFSASEVKAFILTYAQNGVIVLEKHLEDMTVTGDVWSVKLTQEETKKFEGKPAQAQIRVLTNDDTSAASELIWVSVKPVLNDEVLA